MRVLIFAPQFEKGALELLQKELACSLNNFKVKVFTLNTHVEERKKNFTKLDLKKKGISKVFFQDLPLNPNIVQILIGIFKLRILLKKEKIDIIETSSESLSILTILSCIGLKVHHVIGIHKSYNKKNLNFNFFKELVFSFLSKLRGNTHFYAVSNWSKNSWINFSKTKERKVKVISNSIKISNLKKNSVSFKKKFLSEVDIPHNSKLILSVGRICFHKRQDFIIESLAPIIKKNNIFLIFIGEVDLGIKGSLETTNNIKKLIKRYDIKSNVRFLGFRDDVKEIMSISDVFVHSTLTEAFGLVLLEAMGYGLPIVSTKVDAIPELVSENDNFLVGENDQESFRTCVEKTLKREQKHKLEISKRNKKIAKNKNFTPEERTRKMVNYFYEILK